MALSGTKDLTHGNPLKLVLGFTVPLIFGLLFQQLYNVVDTAIVGRYLGAGCLAAVGCTGSLNFLVLGFCMGTCSGFGIPVAQHFGARNYSEMRRYVFNSVYLAAALSVIMAVSTTLLCSAILRVTNTPADIFDDAVMYIQIIFAGIPITVIYNLCAGILRSLGDSRTPVVFLIMASLINVALDLLLILAFHMGVAGAAIATVFSQLCSGIGCIWVLVKRFPVLRPENGETKPRRKHMKKLMSMGVPMGLQYSITAIGTVVLQAAVNGLGSLAVGAVTAASKVSQFFSCFYDALATTMSTFAGQNAGAGKPERIGKGLSAAFWTGTAYSAAALAAIWLFGNSFLSLFLNAGETEMRDMAMVMLKINSALYLFLLIVNIFRMTIQGMGYTRIAMLAGVMELFARTGVGLFLVAPFGFTAACYAGPVAWIAADIFLIPCYLRLSRRMKAALAPEA